ncbi:unnamed protein product [Mytilus coruscus]|uniref:Endonuclease/exonuclease/phosphatase domain-containing protein n=1 Tax=Mytilus coruscus TaxID=42192 RepID=A0A6J8DRA4_MYTCO|nr:unnamed protein product [Mytilus coruscus]
MSQVDNPEINIDQNFDIETENTQIENQTPSIPNKDRKNMSDIRKTIIKPPSKDVNDLKNWETLITGIRNIAVNQDTHNNPEIIYVQATHFKDNRYVKLQGYHPPIIRNRKIPIQPKGKNKKRSQIGGGVAIYVSVQVNFSQLNFNTDNIEVLGVSVNCQNNKINIVYVYRPPNQDIKFNDYQEVLHNLSDNIVLLGDFNSRSSMWGSSTTDSNGNIIEKVKRS